MTAIILQFPDRPRPQQDDWEPWPTEYEPCGSCEAPYTDARCGDTGELCCPDCQHWGVMRPPSASQPAEPYADNPLYDCVHGYRGPDITECPGCCPTYTDVPEDEQPAPSDDPAPF